MIYNSHTLLNGLRIIHLPTSSPVSYCGFAVNVGTRDEAPGEFGMAHFVEHVIFKGTLRRKSGHILNRMENVGGEMNAYTAKEETVIYSVFLELHLERAMELLSDLIVNSQFPMNEIEKEKGVILDEINSYKDNPSELIFDEFENKLFANHALGHNILGDEDHLNQFDSLACRQFLERHYTADNMVFFSMGNTDFKKIIRLATRYFLEIKHTGEKTNRISPQVYFPFYEKEKRESYQTHAIIGNRTFDMYDDRRTTMFMLNNILGGPGMNSRLNISLREKKGYVYNVESAFTALTDTGIFSIYFGSDSKYSERCTHLIFNELKKLREKALTPAQLSTAKKQLIGQIGVGCDQRENIALGLGKSFLHYGNYRSIEEVSAQIEQITSQDLLTLANEVFREDSLSTLLFY